MHELMKCNLSIFHLEKKISFGFYRCMIACYDGGTQAVDYAPEGMIMENLRET